MKVLMVMRQRPLLLGLVAILWLTAVGAMLLMRGTKTEPVDSFVSCAEAGYPVSDGDPSVCQHGISYFTGPAKALEPTITDVQSEPFDLLVSADSRTSTPRQQVVIRSQDAWSSWWGKVHAGLTLPPLISVDFATNNIVLIIGGPKETTGYGYKVTSVTTGKRTTIIDTLESIPTISCPVDIRRSNRYFIVRTAKLSDPVVFRNSEDRRHCI